MHDKMKVSLKQLIYFAIKNPFMATSGDKKLIARSTFPSSNASLIHIHTHTSLVSSTNGLPFKNKLTAQCS